LPNRRGPVLLSRGKSDSREQYYERKYHGLEEDQQFSVHEKVFHFLLPFLPNMDVYPNLEVFVRGSLLVFYFRVDLANTGLHVDLHCHVRYTIGSVGVDIIIPLNSSG
jgi:hypothetical protein